MKTNVKDMKKLLDTASKLMQGQSKHLDTLVGQLDDAGMKEDFFEMHRQATDALKKGDSTGLDSLLKRLTLLKSKSNAS